MLLANQNQRPLVANGSFAFRLVPGPGELPAIVPAVAIFYTPRTEIEVIAFDAWTDPADPFVAGGGATTVRIVTVNGTGAVWATLSNTVIGNWNTQSQGAGFRVAGTATGELENTFAPNSAYVPSNANVMHSLAMSCDAGTVTGKLLFRLHYYPVNPSIPVLP